MAGGPLPEGWNNKLVAVSLQRGGATFEVPLNSSNDGGIFVTREVEEGTPPQTIARQYFIPWSSIQYLTLIDAVEDPDAQTEDEPPRRRGEGFSF